MAAAGGPDGAGLGLDGTGGVAPTAVHRGIGAVGAEGADDWADAGTTASARSAAVMSAALDDRRT
jgi:hypothetical protein